MCVLWGKIETGTPDACAAYKQHTRRFFIRHRWRRVPPSHQIRQKNRRGGTRAVALWTSPALASSPRFSIDQRHFCRAYYRAVEFASPSF